MRFLLVSADQPTVKKSIEIPDRLVNNSNPVVVSKKKHTAKKRKNSKTKTTHPRINRAGAINKPNQSSKSIIRKNGSVHYRDER